MNIKSVALIPARSGSKRVPNKNIRLLNDHPLLAYTICSAIESGIFDSVICATDSPSYAEIAKYYGAEVPFLRSKEISGDKSPDIEWVRWILKELNHTGRNFDVFSLLRPTSPLRMPETIRRAFNIFINDVRADSLRAVEKCEQHPGKMWTIRGERMLPLMPFEYNKTPWHSSQYSALPEVYIQNASLEIAWTRIVVEKNSIAGDSIIPFISEADEGFDINQPDDWILLEQYLLNNKVILPTVKKPPFNLSTLIEP